MARLPLPKPLSFSFLHQTVVAPPTSPLLPSIPLARLRQFPRTCRRQLPWTCCQTRGRIVSLFILRLPPRRRRRFLGSVVNHSIQYESGARFIRTNSTTMVNGDKLEEIEATPFTHSPIFSDGNLPRTSVLVAKHLQTTYGILTQHQQATDFYAFLMQDTIQPLELNAKTTPIIALVNIPISSKF